MEFRIYHGDVLVNIEETEEKKQQLFDRLIKYVKDFDCINGETVHQRDECVINAPEVLSDMIDNILEPKTEWDIQ